MRRSSWPTDTAANSQLRPTTEFWHPQGELRDTTRHVGSVPKPHLPRHPERYRRGAQTHCCSTARRSRGQSSFPSLPAFGTPRCVHAHTATALVRHQQDGGVNRSPAHPVRRRRQPPARSRHPRLRAARLSVQRGAGSDRASAGGGRIRSPPAPANSAPTASRRRVRALQRSAPGPFVSHPPWSPDHRTRPPS